MYKFPSRPVLPELVRLSPDDNSKPAESLYLLNWKPKERQMKIDYDKWITHINPKPITPRPFKVTELFPVEYIDWLYKLRFAIPNYYIREIAYQAKHGQEEWSRVFPEDYNHGMDTCVREHCLKSAEAHFETVFYLLADCLFDTQKEKKDRELWFFAKVAMLIYFWDGQTGSGLLTGDLSGGYDRLPELYLHSNRKVKCSASTVNLVYNFQQLIFERQIENEKKCIGEPL